MGRKTWTAPKAKLTSAQIANVKKLVDAANSSGASKAEENAKIAEPLFEKALKMRLIGWKFEKGTSVDLVLTGRTYEVSATAKDAGGVWSDSHKAYFFRKGTVDTAKFEKLLDTIEAKSNRLAVQVEQVTDFLRNPRKWPTLDVALRFDEPNRIVIVQGNTRPVKNTIGSKIPEIRWQSDKNYWAVARTKVTREELENLTEALDKLEEKALAESAPEQVPTVEAPSEKPRPHETPKPDYSRRPNRKPDNCYTCGGWVDVGEGHIVQVYDPESESEMRWVVYHNDKKTCEAVQEAHKIRQEKARTKQQARRNLFDLCVKPEHYVEGTGHRPRGTEVMIDEAGMAYGGGTWVVVEPDEQYFWFVLNNGHDGDDWSRNNVMTGGAGAIGYRLRMTTEAQVLIDAAKKD